MSEFVTVDTINWSRWNPRERCVLCFIVDHDKVLLIHKKQGFGAGKINGPGGKITTSKGETPLEAAIRETKEEIGMTPLGVEKTGELYFQFKDNHSIHCTVFRASGYVGEMKETPEAKPFWCPIDSVPFNQMWEDDVYWFSKMLRKESFQAYFVFDGDQLCSMEMAVDALPPRLRKDPSHEVTPSAKKTAQVIEALPRYVQDSGIDLPGGCILGG